MVVALQETYVGGTGALFVDRDACSKTPQRMYRSVHADPMIAVNATAAIFRSGTSRAINEHHSAISCVDSSGAKMSASVQLVIMASTPRVWATCNQILKGSAHAAINIIALTRARWIVELGLNVEPHLITLSSVATHSINTIATGTTIKTTHT